MTGHPATHLSIPIRLALGAALVGVVFLCLSAVHPGFHESVCQDSAAADHECAITTFSTGKLVPVASPVAPQAPPVSREATILPVDTEASIRTDYLTSPGRDPPAA